MIPSLIEIKILVKRPIFKTLGNKGLIGWPTFPLFLPLCQKKTFPLFSLQF